MKLSLTDLYAWYRNTLRNPKYRWWIVLGTVAYLIFPFDIAPDFLPIIGQIDDLAIVGLLIAELSQIAMDWFQKRQEAAANVTTADASATTVDVDAV